MTEDLAGRADLQATALNDIESCVKAIFINPDETAAEKWNDLNLSLQTAIRLGVTMESALSKLLNSMPDPVIREHIISQVAKKHHLSDEEIDELTAPED